MQQRYTIFTWDVLDKCWHDCCGFDRKSEAEAEMRMMKRDDPSEYVVIGHDDTIEAMMDTRENIPAPQ